MMRAPRLLPLTAALMVVLAGFKAVDLAQHLIPAFAPGLAPVLDPVLEPVLGAGKLVSEASAATPAPAAPAAAALPNAAPPMMAPPVGAPPISDGERTLLLELRARSAALDKHERDIAAREALLAAASQRLQARLDELTALQAKLQTLEDTRHKHDEDNWAGLVKTYEAMKPRDAAVIFDALDMTVLLPVLDRMKDTKAALILAAMDPGRARAVTLALAQTRLRANSPSPSG